MAKKLTAKSRAIRKLVARKVRRTRTGAIIPKGIEPSPRYHITEHDHNRRILREQECDNLGKAAALVDQWRANRLAANSQVTMITV
jgi:hypothetical protein